MRPLDGVRVLDFTWVVAGPVATRILADLGADVIKVERRGAADFGDRRGGLSGTLMRGKRSVVVDLNRPRGLDLARRLAAVSDVVIDNFSARVMSNLGLDYEELRRLRPDVICVRMTGFGLTGPYRDHVSYGPTLQALAGYTLLMAEPGEPPAGFGYSYSDLAGGNLGALAVLAALWHRRRTGRGQLVDLAQLEAVASLVGPTLLARALDGGASTPTGNASQEEPGAPHGVYPCAGDDRWLAITVFSDEDWARFAHAIGDPEWTTRFVTRAARLEHAAELDRLVAAWSRTQVAEEAMARLQGAGVAAGVVAGADVAFIYRRDAAAAAEVEARVRALGRRCLPLQADLGEPVAVAAALDRLAAETDHVDVLVANAAATAFKPLLEVKPHHVEKTYAITVGAFLQMVQRIAPRMPGGGRIVTISGMDTHRYVAGHGVLASAKAALEALTRYLAVELGPRGITVNSINPGYVDTDSVALYFGDEPSRRAFFEEVEGTTPLRAVGEPAEVASLVAFLCSPEASWMQGQVLYLDGGIFLHAPGHSVRWWRRTGRMS